MTSTWLVGFSVIDPPMVGAGGCKCTLRGGREAKALPPLIDHSVSDVDGEQGVAVRRRHPRLAVVMVLLVCIEVALVVWLVLLLAG